MKTRSIRWGILGSGRIAKKFAADIFYSGNGELAATASRSIERSTSLAQEFNAPKAYASYEELVEDPDIDAIYVATPHSHHHQHTLLCLRHNKPVLCEKAFAVNAREANEMIGLARSKKTFLMEALWTKFLPHQQKMEALIKEGKIGEVRSVLVNFGFRPQLPAPQRIYDPLLAGGSLLDIGIYNVFAATSVLGKPDHVDAYMTPAATGVDDQCAILFRYHNGAMAQLFSTFSSDLATEANFHGTEGRIQLTHRFYAPDSEIRFYEGRPDSFEVIETGVSNEGFGYQYEIRHVGECLLAGLSESPVVTLNDTLERMELLDEIRRKAGIVYPMD